MNLKDTLRFVYLYIGLF